MKAKVSNSIGMEFSLIQAGKFERSYSDRIDSDVEEKRQTVIVKKPFYLGVTPVTRNQYRKVMETDPTPKNLLDPNDGDWPIANITYFDAIDFCKKLTQIEQADGKNITYRLPSELEWEYAQILGKTTRDFTDEEFRELEFEERDQYYSYQRPVAQYRANDLGLYDMIGWIRQLCDDRYITNKILGKATDCRTRPSWLQSCWCTIKSNFEEDEYTNSQTARKAALKRKKINRSQTTTSTKERSSASTFSSELDQEAKSDNQRTFKFPNPGALATSNIEGRPGERFDLLVHQINWMMWILPMMIYYGAPRVTRGFNSNQIRGWVLPNIRTHYNGFRIALETDIC